VALAPNMFQPYVEKASSSAVSSSGKDLCARLNEHVIAKLAVSDRIQAAVRAMELGLVHVTSQTPTDSSD
jgi:hypothetical protein